MFSKVLAAATAVVAFAGAPSFVIAQDVDYAAEVEALGGDAEAGQKVYRKCRACHVVDREQNRVGPHQVGVIGRPAGSIEGYRYSDAMAESGIVWNVETLTEYLRAPKDYVEGTKMNFAGLKDDQEIADVITYLFEEGGVHGAGTN